MSSSPKEYPETEGTPSSSFSAGVCKRLLPGEQESGLMINDIQL